MNKYQSIRQIVRSCYDLQKMRIAMGLRLVSIYRERDLGNVTEESESFSLRRITLALPIAWLKTSKTFQSDPLIS